MLLKHFWNHGLQNTYKYNFCNTLFTVSVQINIRIVYIKYLHNITTLHSGRLDCSFFIIGSTAATHNNVIKAVPQWNTLKGIKCTLKMFKACDGI